MMINSHRYNSRDLGKENLHHNSMPIQFSSSSKLQNPQSLFIPRVFLGFNNNISNLHSIAKSHSSNQCSRGSKILLGFKVNCNSKSSVVVPKKGFSINGKKKYGGILPSILRSLDCSDDIEKTLRSCCENLSPKEQTVVLKEQGNSWERVFRVFQWFKSQGDYVPNVIHYNIVLRALGRAKRWDKLRLCWTEMAKNGVVPTINTYGMLVDVYGKAGLVLEAILWVKHMRLRGMFPDEVTMSTVVRVLKDAREFDRADRFYKDWCIGKVELDEFDLDEGDSVYGSGSEPVNLKHFLLTELFRVSNRIPNPKIITSSSSSGNSVRRKPHLTSTYNTLIDLYGKAGRLKEAAEVFSDMLKSGVPMDTITFNTMIFTCGTHGDIFEAEALLTKMEERRIRPDTKTYNIFLSLYAADGKIDEALRCYRKIREVGLFPDVVTHRALLHVLCERKMVKEAENVVTEMEKASVLVDEHSLPDFVKMYVDEGSIDRAKLFIDKFRSGLNGAYSSKISAAIIDAFAEKGHWAEAESVFFTKRDFVGENKMDVVEFNVMFKAYGKAKLYDKALNLFKEMRGYGTWPDDCTYNSLIQMFSGADLVGHARGFLTEMQEIGLKPNCKTFSAVIACYTRLGQVSEAIDVYQEMVRSGVKPNEVIYGALIDGFAEIGRIEEALKYYSLMKESGFPENQIVLTSLIKVYSKLGYVEGAKAVYDKIRISEMGPDIIASNSMLNLYADLGMVSEAKLVFENLRQKGSADGVSFATMMYLYKSMGMIDEAIEIAEEMKESGLLRDCTSFNKVMACYATNGQLLECGELLRDMITRKLLPDKGTFKVLFTVLKKGGSPIEAVTQLESAYYEGKPYARHAVIALVFSIVGLKDFALESSESFLKADMALDASAYNVAIYAYGAVAEIEKALNVFMKMQDEGLEPDLVTYINLIGCYGKASMVEGVKRIYSQLKYGEIEPNESLFNAIINAYKSMNRHDLANLVSQEMKFAFKSEEHVDSEEDEEMSDESSHEDASDEDFSDS